VSCWGYDFALQAYPDVAWTSAFVAQHGVVPGSITRPMVVPGLTGVADVSAGSPTCALLGDGTARCWGCGWPDDGLAGVAPDVPRRVPLDHVTQIAGGDNVGYALTDDGRAYAFEFGMGPTPIVPVELPDLAGASRLFPTPWELDMTPISEVGGGGGAYVAATFPDGTLRVAGDGLAVPVGLVPEATGARLVAASHDVLCVVVGDDEIRCAGANDHGQLGRLRVDATPQPMGAVLWPAAPPALH
jgi:hypothetical protein